MTATLMLHLTGRCNLRCQHCYMEGAPDRREQLPRRWVVDAVRDAPGLGVGTVFLTGGEPTMYEHFEDVLAACAETDGLATTVCTNGTALRSRHLDQFVDFGVSAHVSLDGDETSHDDLRASRGSHGRARAAVARLTGAGVATTVVTTVHQGNLHAFGAVARWAADVGVERLLVQPLLALGRATNIAELMLTTDQLNALIVEVSDVANSLAHHPLKVSIIGANRAYLLAHPCAAYVCNGEACHRGVVAEIKKIVVREDGVVLPEATNLHPRYAMGHVDDGRLETVVRRFFDTGYAAFDALCRDSYRLVADWPDVIVPWDQLLADRSHRVRNDGVAVAAPRHPSASRCGEPVEASRALPP